MLFSKDIIHFLEKKILMQEVDIWLGVRQISIFIY